MQCVTVNGSKVQCLCCDSGCLFPLLLLILLLLLLLLLQNNPAAAAACRFMWCTSVLWRCQPLRCCS